MFAAWRYGGEDPWRLYNLLDAAYRPLANPTRAPVRPKFPMRVRAFMYACARAALIMEGKMDATSGSGGGK